ncbi:MAG: hypothetical protein U0136_08310 [Bdellovibrionota bacterium]
MQFRLSQDDPYFYVYCGVLALISLGVYWFIWKRNSMLANILVFGALVGLMAYLTNWDYALNHYFRVSNWRIPGS